MKPCRFSTTSRIYRNIGIIVFLLAAFGASFAGMYLLTHLFLYYKRCVASEIITIILASIIALLIATLLLIMASKFYTMETRRYAISENGIDLNDKNKRHYDWSEIWDVAIVAYGSSASLQSYQSIICVFLEPPTESFFERLSRSYLFGVFHQKSIVIIDYTPTILTEFEALFPSKIVDYRYKTQGDGLREP